MVKDTEAFYRVCEQLQNINKRDPYLLRRIADMMERVAESEGPHLAVSSAELALHYRASQMERDRVLQEQELVKSLGIHG